MRRYWFRAKRYGWGWTPTSWQGWAALIAYAVLFASLVAGAGVAAAGARVALAVALSVAAVAVTGALAWVGWRTGEPSRWRWG